jgi:hypothetical protein
MVAEETVNMIEHSRGIRAQSHAGQRTLQQVRAKRSAEALAGNVRKQERGTIFAQGENVKVITAYRQAGKIDTGDGEVRVIAKILR